MTVKHAPATPLPWLLEARAVGVPVFAIFGKDGTHVAKVDGAGNAAYIDHTAHAYPKLVEALRFSMGCTVAGSINAERLLRELGEMS